MSDLEGVLAETGYHSYFEALEAEDLLPGLRQGLHHLKQDESRHIAYGVFLLTRLVAALEIAFDTVDQDPAEFLFDLRAGVSAARRRLGGYVG